MEKEKAFAEMYKTAFPDWVDNDFDNDYSYFISPPTLADLNCYVFAASNGKQVRIVAAELEYIISESIHDLSNIVVKECFITNDELKIIIAELDAIKIDNFMCGDNSGLD